jgi:protein-S-isoprenylcysteine O-methyltransferase Ste14
MSAAALAFRFRVFIFVLLYVLGFLPPPWDFSSGSRSTLWLAAPTLLARGGWISLAPATIVVTIAALVCLVAGALLRVWGTAYLGSGVMRDSALHGEGLVAAGPYRHMRNPLYLGSWLLALGASVLMPLDGALFFLPAFSIFVFLLITTEERFLSAKLGNPYQQYRRLVPRLLPRFAAGPPPASARPHWMQAVLAETYAIAFTLCFAVLAWRYNARILIQCLLVCYGASLVLRAMQRRPTEEAKEPSTEQNPEGL